MPEGPAESGLTAQLLEACEGAPSPGPEFSRKISELGRAHGIPGCSRLIDLLAGIQRPEPEAVRTIEDIAAHRETLRVSLGRDPGFALAAFDWFINLERRLHCPRMVENVRFAEMERLAATDPLTGLPNRRRLRLAAEAELRRAGRYGLPVSMLFFDLDDFKDANDRWGHARGDQLLREVAELIRGSVREVDVPARYGGEEFAVLLPETARDGAVAVAERIRRGVEARRIESTGEGPRLTISGGLATFPDDAADLDTLLRHADEALYAAKASGKNRIVATGPERRRHARLPLGEVPLHPHVLLSGAPGRARNISRGGALVEADVALPAGAPVELRFERTDGGGDLLLSGQVARASPRERAGGRVFELGIDFLGTPARSLEELDRLLRVPAPGADEGRP